jgi:hypothetical protein
MKITPATLRAMLDEFGGIPMSEEELKQVTPVVEAFVAEFSRLGELDLGDIDSALQMHADDGEFSRDR